MKKYFSGVIIKNDVDRLEYRSGGGGTVEIFDIVVNSSPRSGVGTELVKELLDMDLGRVFAITHSQNEVAQRFYEKNGFVGTLLPNFYPIVSPYKTGDAYLYVYEKNTK